VPRKSLWADICATDTRAPFAQTCRCFEKAPAGMAAGVPWWGRSCGATPSYIGLLMASERAAEALRRQAGQAGARAGGLSLM